ncbi:Syntaxin-6 [Smittium mucronatum]|uniref:t-SNARE affecting a late Golgi compartment protein 1 n=1 Tax=Smittium mucronatum TaxID=133383 RepID=A0A1R0H3X6_9FUNG|nr:Syntaxin-6 [Smittium mucronatum]
MNDPFEIVKEDVEQALEQSNDMMYDWDRLRKQSSSTKPNSELDYIKQDLYNIFNSVEQDLSDLQSTVDIARQNPQKFGLDSAKLAARQKFIDTSFDKMKTPAQQDSNNSTNHMIIDFAAQQQQQQIILEQQDEHMDSILGTVRNLRGIAGAMNTELDDQAILLDEVDTMVDGTQSRLASARRRVNDFLRKSQGTFPPFNIYL